MNVSNNDANLEVFRLMVDQAPNAIILADASGTIQIWNTAATELFGYSPDEIIGKSLDAIIPEHLRKAHWKGFDGAMASGHTKHGGRTIKTRAIHKAGRKLYVNLAFSVVKDRSSNVIGAMATAREFIENP